MQRKEMVLAMMAAAVLTAGTARVAHAAAAGCYDTCGQAFGYFNIYSDGSSEKLEYCVDDGSGTIYCYYSSTPAS